MSKGYLEEELRYYASIGDELNVEKLIGLKVDVNSKNSVNGWTALHWAVHRNHPRVVKLLLENGADPAIRNHDMERPFQFIETAAVEETPAASDNTRRWLDKLPITPSYLKHPTLPTHLNCKSYDEYMGLIKHRNVTHACKDDNIPREIILKVRIADAQDPDFIEVELKKEDLTVEKLTDVCCNEFQVDKKNVLKIRKLPDTVIRKDKDVERLQDFQEIEIVLSVNY